ncbi:hypothetical protein CBS101457_001432 [Exobasidium rhododendri]|nr:hypothetical protein CBS101457_001432 [Exobasidium rhododendri]
MDRWTPLAPTKRASGLYARADLSQARSTDLSLTKSKSNTLDTSISRKSQGSENVDRTPLPPSDPFPPVGVLPRFVALHILSFLPLADQVNCALAGRSLASAVADERNWSRRLDALDWCRVDGLKVDVEERGGEETERCIGRRRKGKGRSKEEKKVPDKRDAKGAAHFKVAQRGVSDIAEEDDFGDFTSTTKNDSFSDFTLEKIPLGGSYASGTASVALGRGQAFQDQSSFSSQPLSPLKHNQSVGAVASGSALFSYSAETKLPLSSASTSFRRLQSYAKALRPYLNSILDVSAPSTSSLLFTCDLGLSAQAALLSNLLRFISTSVGGYRRPVKRPTSTFTIDDEDDNDKQTTLVSRSQEAAQHLALTLLSSFEGTLARRGDAVRAATHGADTTRAIHRAEDDMQTHANGIWELGNARLALELSEKEEFLDEKDNFGRMKAARSYLDHLEIFSLGLRGHDPLENVASRPALDFTPMDAFMAEILEAMKSDGNIIARVFPPEQDVLLAYADRVASEIIAEYIARLLDHTKALSRHLYLRSCAATFAQAFKVVNVMLGIESRDEDFVSQTRCEDVIYRMWESNMDGYLENERSWVREEMQKVVEKWESDRESEASASRVDAAFLNSQNPAAVKRSVLSGFKDVLLLPVTVVPRTAGIVGGAVIRTAGTGLSSLNPRRWQAGGASSGVKRSSSPSNTNTGSNSAHPTATIPRSPNELNEKGYMDFSNGAVGNGNGFGLHDGDDEDDDDDNDGNNDSLYGDKDLNEKDEWNQEVEAWGAIATARPQAEKAKPAATKVVATKKVPEMSTMSSRSATPTTAPPPSTGKTMLTQMQLLLSLDTALQVIHINRDCLKRIETFLKYPSPLGEKVRALIQEVSLLCFRALGEGHINPGFEKATDQIRDWKPEEHVRESAGEKEEGEQQEVEPLVHFFELVHVGDTIAQMVQVYYDQELSKHIDRNDFMNAVVKGKKKFESHLDELVAKGLNAGVDLLLNQAEHIVTTRQERSDYFPEQGLLTDLSPTRACREAVQCLQLHCKMLIGTTDKNVLEVFYQEVGIRLYSVICKHLKKQNISIDGGFKVIADLNHYHAFISTLKQASVTADFESLKMLGNIFIIDNPKELAKIARDANMFGGTLSPEELYEFLHARSDFKLIEKAVDKEMYGFKMAEDCSIM